MTREEQKALDDALARQRLAIMAQNRARAMEPYRPRKPAEVKGTTPHARRETWNPHSDCE